MNSEDLFYLHPKWLDHRSPSVGKNNPCRDPVKHKRSLRFMGDFVCWSITGLIMHDVTYWASIITLSQILDCNCDWFMMSIFGKNVSFAFFEDLKIFRWI